MTDECGDVHGRFRYTPGDGGPDPLAPPFDLAAALDAIGQDVLAGGSLREALRELLRRGMDGRRGLDDLAERVRRLRARPPAGEATSTAPSTRCGRCSTRRSPRSASTLARRVIGDDGPTSREMELANRPRDVAGGRARAGDYDWRRAEAREAYEQIKDLLRRELLDQRFAGMKQALENATDEAVQAVKEMLADLNELLDAHARGEDTERPVRRLHGQARRLLPRAARERRRADRRPRPPRRPRPADA